MTHFSVLIRLLRDRKTFLEEVRTSTKLESKIVSLLIASTVFFAVYGAIIGAYGGGLQIISSAIKLPALYLLTLLICLPTLYFFDILSGSKLDFRQYLTMALTAVSIISVLLFGFAPVILFFLISIKDYIFFLLLNVFVMAITGAIGVRLFYKGMKDMVIDPHAIALQAVDGIEEVLPPAVAMREKVKAKKSSRRYLLQGWVLLYALVGSQLGWTLRPFLSVEGEPFQIFRPEIDGNFYAQVFRSIGTLLGWH
ncbi:MAG: actin-binding WH2 domain-containing protein [Cyanobacteria bacterium P01_D01_bin.105]